MKTCTKCRQTLPLEMFNKSKKGKYGVTSCCKSCTAEYRKKHYKENKEIEISVNKKWRTENLERKRQIVKEWKLNNLNKVSEVRKQHYKSNKETESITQKVWKTNNLDKVRKIHKKYRTNNPGKINAKNAKRRAALLQRILPGTDLKAIEQVYIKCPSGMTVDHIIPLQGKIISGLHKVENLQYLSGLDNSRKQNYYETF